jgi:hypothetical protein
MRCRAVICADCCTRVDGVNHCHACLKRLGRRAAEPRRAPGAVAAGVAAAGLLAATWAAFVGVFYLVQGRFAP